MAIQESLTKRTFKAFFWQFGGTIFKAFVQLGVLFFLARLISKADFGIVQSAIIVMGLATLLGQMGVGPALVQKKELTPLHIRSGLTISFGLSLLLFFITYFSSGLIADFFRMPDLIKVLRVVSVIFVLEGITTVSQSLLLRKMKQKTLVVIDLISYAIGYGCVSVFMAFHDYGYWSLIWGQLVQSFLKCILSYGIERHSVSPYYGEKEYKELLYFGGGFTLAKFFNYFGGQGDKIIAGRYLGADLLGVYSNAFSLMIQPASLIGKSIDMALFPAMALKQNNRKKLINGFISGSRIITFLAIPISVILIVSAETLIGIILGSKWNDVVIPFQILTTVFVFRIGYKMGDSLCRATGWVYQRAIVQFIYAVVMIVGTFFGASIAGVAGVATGAAIAITLNYILMVALSLKILEISWSFYLKETLFQNIVPLGILTTFFILVFYLSRYFVKQEVYSLIVSFIVYGVVVSLLFYHFSSKLKFLAALPFKKALSKITKK